MKDIGQVLGEKTLMHASSGGDEAARSHLITTNPNKLDETTSLLQSIKGGKHESINAQTMAITDIDPHNSILHTGHRRLSFLMGSTITAEATIPQ